MLDIPRAFKHIGTENCHKFTFQCIIWKVRSLWAFYSQLLVCNISSNYSVPWWNGRIKTVGKRCFGVVSDAVEGILSLGSSDPQILLINLDLLNYFEW